MPEKLHALLGEDTVLPDLAGRTRGEVLKEMTERLEEGGRISRETGLLARLLEREALGTTSIGRGVAVPHCRVREINAPVLLLGLSRAGVPFEAVDGKPCHVFFLLVSSQDNPGAGLRILASIAGLTRRSRSLVSKLLKAAGPLSILDVIREEQEKVRA